MFRSSRSNWRDPSQDRMAMTGFQRSPLYPIGPSIPQTTVYQPIYGGTNFPRPASPYVKHKPLAPSYESRMIERQQRISHHPNYEQRQKKLLAMNESEIEAQARRRQAMKLSFEREISRITLMLNKNTERKQKLKSQLQILQFDASQLKQKLQDLKPVELPKLGDALQKKQEQIIRLKTQMINEMRSKQQQLTRQQEIELNDWEQRLKQKQKILASTEQRRNFAKTQLMKVRREQPQRLIPVQIEQAVRQKKYQQFLYDYDVLRDKINKIIVQRQSSIRSVNEAKYLKEGVFRDQLHRIQEIKRQLTQLQIAVVELESRNKQIEKANQNLEEEDARKEKLIEQYELDINEMKNLIDRKDADFVSQINQFRDGQLRDASSDQLADEIQQTEKMIREVQADSFRLKADYKRLTDLLSSSVGKAIYQTFNDLHFNR